MTSLAALPAFLAYFAASLALLAGCVAIYVRITPHAELTLIRAGNRAAAITLGGAILGFALPISAAVAHSGGLLDAVVWSALALIAQLGAFVLCTAVMLPRWRTAMERDEQGGALLKAAVAVAVGLLNAACLTP